MANTQKVCTSFLKELLTGVHVLGTDTTKAALYVATATVNGSTTIYSVTDEVSGAGYNAGGVTVVYAAPDSSGATAYSTPNAAVNFGTVTLATSFNCCLFYNSSKSNKSIQVITFTAQVVAGANFSITMPTNDSTNALLRLTAS